MINNSLFVTLQAVKGIYCTEKQTICSQLNNLEVLVIRNYPTLVDFKSGIDFGKFEL